MGALTGCAVRTVGERSATRHWPNTIGSSSLTASAPKCSALTKAGSPCKAYAINEQSTCLAHTPELNERSRAKAIVASAEKRRETVETREAAKDEANLGISYWIARYAVDNAKDLAYSLGDAAKADGSSAAMREFLNRHLGKVVEVTQSINGPADMDEASLYRWLTESPTVEDEGASEAKTSDSEPKDAQGHTVRPNSSSKDPL